MSIFIAIQHNAKKYNFKFTSVKSTDQGSQNFMNISAEYNSFQKSCSCRQMPLDSIYIYSSHTEMQDIITLIQYRLYIST
jgi:hypothetical protein